MSHRGLVPMSVMALSLVANEASASLVLAKPGGDVHVSDARVAFSANDKRTVAFEQLVLDEARGELAWVVALPKGGWIEGADDHLFESLDEATAPVIAPAKTLGCAATARESTALPRATIPARSVSKVYAPLSASAAAAQLTSLGFVVDDGARVGFTALEAAGEQVAILVLPAGARGQTRVVRVLGPANRPFPSILAPNTGTTARMHAWVMAPTRVRFFGLPAGEVDANKIAWSGGTSNFPTLLDFAIGASAPGMVVTYSGIDGILVDQSAGTPVSLVPSWSRRYFGAIEGGSSSAFACAAKAIGLATSARVVAPSCAKAPPWFTSETLPGCAVVGADEIAPSELSCGALDDVAVSLGGFAPSRSWLTRFEGLAVPNPKGFLLESVGLSSLPSFREAKLGIDCGGSTSTPPVTSPPDDPDAGYDPSGGGSGSSSSSSSSSSSGEAVGDACGATLEIMAASCSGSSSSSSGSGCSGDSSDSSDSCSGSSSGSSDSGCGGGSSSSSSGGCSSGSGSSGGCGGAASSADDGCRVTRSRARVRFSPVLYAMVAVAAVCRRLGRKRV